MKNILFILLMFTSLLPALDRKVRIADSENKPITNVVVKVAERAFLSNKKGIVSLTAKVETDSILIHKIGYEDLRYIWNELPRNIKLETKAVEIQGISVISTKNSGNITLKKMIIKNDAELYKADTAADLLKNHSEIRLLGSDIAGSEQTVSLLGHQSKHTLVLLDGIPLNNSGQKFDISTIPAEIIESIEIIPQNATATTGAGAIGGAINIITKNEMDSESSIASGISYDSGSFGYEAIGTNLTFSHPNYLLDLNYTWQEAENDFEYEYFLTNNPEARKRLNNQYSDNVMNLNLKINTPLNLKYNFMKQSFIKGLPGPIHQLLNYDKALLTGDVNRHNAAIHKNYKKLLFKLQGFWFEEMTEFNNLESTLPVQRQRGENESYKRGAELQTSYNWEEFNFMLELEHRREGFAYTHYNRYDVYIDHKSISDVFQENNAIALSWGLEGDLNIVNLKFQNTTRFDKIIQHGSNEWEKSWQGEFLIDFDNYLIPEIALRYGTSYALPSFYDLYWVGDSQAQGNPDLRPEYARGESVDLGYEGFWGHLKAGWHHNQIENLIYWSRGTMGWKPHNLDKAELTNYLLDAVVKPVEFLEIGGSWLRTFALNKTLIEAGSGNYDRAIVNTPRSVSALYGKLLFDKLFLQTSYNRTGKQYTLPDETRSLKAYHTIDLQGGFGLEVKEIDLEFTVKINNITDEEYIIYSDNPVPGRSWQAGVSMEYIYK